MLRSLLLGAITLAVTVGAVHARTQRTFVYAPCMTDDAVTVWQVEERGAALRAAGSVRHPIGTRAPVQIALQRSGAYAYVVHAPSAGQGGAISLHSVDPRTGQLEFRSLLLEARGSLALELDRAGQHAYVVDAERAMLRMFSLDPAQGTWRERQAPMPTGSGPCQVLLNPRSTFLFVLNRESCSVSRYRLDAEARPELAGEDVLLNGSRPVHALMDPSGARIYVSFDTYDVLLSMSIDARDGGLRTINAAGTGASPSGLALNATGDRIFVAERGSGSLSAFDIDPHTGQLGARLGPFPAGTAPKSVELAADGRTIWITGGGNDLRSFAVDGHTTVIPGAARRAPGPLGPLAGLAREVTSDVVYVALELRGDGTLSARPEARGGAVPPRSRLSAPALAAEQIVESLEPSDELLVDPLGTWVLALGHRPGRFALIAVDPSGRLGVPGETVAVGPEAAAAAVAPGGCLVAIATRTPAAVHTYSLLEGRAQHLHSLPLTAAPDALVFDSTGRALFLAHTAADRLTTVALDEAGFMVRATAVPLAGGPGPLALSPAGDVLFVGLLSVPGVVPCEIGARSRELVQRIGLGVELPLPPQRLEFAPSAEALLAVLTPGLAPARIDRHPATGALSLLGRSSELPAGNVAHEASASRSAALGTGGPELGTGSAAEGTRGATVRATARIEVALPPPRASEPRGRALERLPSTGATVAADSLRMHAPHD